MTLYDVSVGIHPHTYRSFFFLFSPFCEDIRHRQEWLDLFLSGNYRAENIPVAGPGFAPPKRQWAESSCMYGGAEGFVCLPSGLRLDIVISFEQRFRYGIIAGLHE